MPRRSSEEADLAMEQRSYTELAQDSRSRIVTKCGHGDSLRQEECEAGVDQADMLWRKMQILKEKYLQDMRDLHSTLGTRGQQPMPEGQLQKLKHYMTVLERMIPYLLAPKGGLPKGFQQEQMAAFEKQIVSIMETFKMRKQQSYLGSSSAGQEPHQAARILQPENKLLQQQQQQQQTWQRNSASMELQSDDTSIVSPPLLQSDASSHPHTNGVATQPAPLHSLASTAANGVHRGKMASFGQNTGNPLQVNVPQDQPSYRNGRLKGQERSEQLPVGLVQQVQQLHLEEAQEDRGFAGTAG